VETEELAKLIKTRRSIRAWQGKPVPEEMLLQAVELATWAPNGANAQTWYFYIVLDRNTIKAIADASQASMDNRASWPETAQFGSPPAPATVPPPLRTPLGDAPAMILVGARRTESPTTRVLSERAKVDERAARMLQWNNYLNPRLQSSCAAIAYLLLVLHQMGLGATWMTGPLSNAKGEMEEILKVPSDMDLVALIPVGYPADNPTRERRPVSEVCEVIK